MKLQYEESFLQKLNAKCLENDNSSCIMAKLLTYMNKMLKKPTFTVGKRITLLQTRSVWLFFYRSLNMFFHCIELNGATFCGINSKKSRSPLILVSLQVVSTGFSNAFLFFTLFI